MDSGRIYGILLQISSVSSSYLQIFILHSSDTNVFSTFTSDASEPVFHIFITYFFGFFGYWMCAFIMHAVDASGVLKKFKIDQSNNVPVSNDRIVQTITTTMINQVIFALGQVAIFYCVMSRVLSPHEHDDIYAVPSFWIVMRDILAVNPIYEVVFYIQHRLLHWKPIYNRVHKVHHEWKNPIAISSIYNHPAELATVSFISFVFGPTVMRCHISTIWLLIVVTHISVVVEHSGYHLPFVKSSHFHNFHHSHPNQCFGAFGTLDYFFGTDLKFRESKHFGNHGVFFSLKTKDEETKVE